MVCSYSDKCGLVQIATIFCLLACDKKPKRCSKPNQISCLAFSMKGDECNCLNATESVCLLCLATIFLDCLGLPIKSPALEYAKPYLLFSTTGLPSLSGRAICCFCNVQFLCPLLRLEFYFRYNRIA